MPRRHRRLTPSRRPIRTHLCGNGLRIHNMVEGLEHRRTEHRVARRVCCGVKRQGTRRKNPRASRPKHSQPDYDDRKTHEPPRNRRLPFIGRHGGFRESHPSESQNGDRQPEPHPDRHVPEIKLRPAQRMPCQENVRKQQGFPEEFLFETVAGRQKPDEPQP